MNTVLYIDGFNLYYGCLRHSPYKWLNPAVMAGHLLPGHTITAVRYFSANISARPEALDQPIRQQMYFRALRTLPGLTIQLGYFKAHEVAMKLVHPRPNGPPTAWVWRTDEKGSDVNLATQLLVDAAELASSESALANDHECGLQLQTLDHTCLIGNWHASTAQKRTGWQKWVPRWGSW